MPNSFDSSRSAQSAKEATKVRAHAKLGKTMRRRLPPWLHNRDLGLLLSARLLVSTGRALAGIVTPIYLSKIGFSGVELGLLFAVTAVASGAMTAAVGLFADRYGCKPFLLIFPLLTALAAIAYLLTPATLPIFIFSALGTVG